MQKLKDDAQETAIEAENEAKTVCPQNGRQN